MKTTKILQLQFQYSLYKITIVGFNRYSALFLESVIADSSSVEVRFFKIDFSTNVFKSKAALFSLPYVIVFAVTSSKVVFSRQYLLDHKLFYFCLT